jgi:hypothetical protein
MTDEPSMDMANKSVAEMVAELLATGTMNEDTVADLNAYLAADRAGTLDPLDLSYLRGLHARITGAPLPEPEPEVALAGGLTATEWRARAEAAEAEVARLQALLADRDAVADDMPPTA